MRQGAIDEAERFGQEAFDLIARTDALNRQADSLVVLGEVFRIGGREVEGLDQIRRALHLYEQKGNTVSADQARAVLLDTALAE